MKTLYLLLLSGTASFGAGHNTLLPQPQQLRYGNGRLPVHGLSVVLASPSASEDTFTVALLTDGLAWHGGSPGSHTIRLTRTAAVDALPRDNEQPGPGSREPYHLRITPEGGAVTAR